MQNNDVEFYKKNPRDKIWWIKDPNVIGMFKFTFDKKKIYNMYEDYPNNLTIKEKVIFDSENPFWDHYFNG